jgi:3-hydroxybutyryl-CoA dehydrogenase
MSSKLIAIIGAGVMGSDVAIDLANHNYDVILKDLTEKQLDNAKSNIQKSYRFYKLMLKEAFPSNIDEILAKIRFTTVYESFHEADIIIENITENYIQKKNLYLELSRRFREDAILGVNTSCISITKLAAIMPHPENVIGMHFMNPVPLSKLVEVIKGHHTSDETINLTKSFLKTLNKTYVVVNDFPGFVTNRVLMLTINESIWLVHEKVAESKEIDLIFKLGFGHKIGPLATADLIGLDTILNSLEVLYDSYKDPKYKPCPLLIKMVDAGLLGKKSGKGFFKY